MFWNTDSDGGESTTKQATLDEVVDDYEPVPREFQWRVGLREGLKALLVLSAGLAGVFYLIQTNTLHIAIGTGIGTAVLMEVYGLADFLEELV